MHFMIEVLYFKIPADLPLEDFFSAMRENVSNATYNALHNYRHRQTAIQRIAGESLVGLHLRKTRRTEIKNLHINKEEHGKPYIEALPDYHFNISHSGKYVIAAFSSQPIGIDIERRGRTRMNVAQRFFHPEECSLLQQLSEEERKERLTDYWAVKESFLKYLGTGLTRSLSSFQVLFKNGEVALLEEEHLLPLHIIPCPIDPEFACYLCTTSPAPVRITEIKLFPGQA